MKFFSARRASIRSKNKGGPGPPGPSPGSATAIEREVCLFVYPYKKRGGFKQQKYLKTELLAKRTIIHFFNRLNIYYFNGKIWFFSFCLRNDLNTEIVSDLTKRFSFFFLSKAMSVYKYSCLSGTFHGLSRLRRTSVVRSEERHCCISRLNQLKP